MPVKVGVVLVNAAGCTAALRDIPGAVGHAERVGLDSLWASDHLLIPGLPVLDAPSVMAAAAIASRQLQLGLSVMVPSLRSIGWAAKQVGTLSLLVAPRRLQLGVGVSGGPIEEFRAAEVDMTARGQRTNQFLASLPDLLAGKTVRTAGPRGKEGIALQPAAPMPTLWVGGSSPAALRRVARFGDGWLPGLITPREFTKARERLSDLTAAHERDRPRLAVMAHVSFTTVRGPTAQQRAVGLLRSAYQMPTARAEQLAIAGTPTQAAQRLNQYVEAGAEHLVLVCDGPEWPDTCDSIAEVAQCLSTG
ncbi:LLM class flavin-dependent oxidoreductase [Mycobacterium sherrisii]|uniref:LLM class flavin-dependent oxidoreductase n=1 Tax=Mycobacterium sherrisii TaxID=243061 RepID=UPI003976A1AA